MYKKKFLFVSFEGIEGSGKSFQSKKLFKKLREKKIPAIYTREPGGCSGAEEIRKIILSGAQNKFDPLTDTLLYLASRNEHLDKVIIPAIKKKIIVICDRFVDSTIAYQVYGSKVDKLLIDTIHNTILGKFKPHLTFVLKLNLEKAFSRMEKRKSKNRYDTFSKSFYNKVQNGFIKIAKEDKKRYVVLDTTLDTKDTEKIIYKNFIKLLRK